MKTLMMDTSLWNSDLTRSFAHTPEPILISLGEEAESVGGLPTDSVAAAARSCRPNLDLLPGMEHWLESPALRGENGWNLIHSLLAQAAGRWGIVVADLGSHIERGGAGDNTFLLSTAVHASILQAASTIIGICDSIEYLKLWQDTGNTDPALYAKTLFVVNRYRADLPFGLDRFKVDRGIRAQGYLIPALKGGLLPESGRSFFVERVFESGNVSGEESKAAHEFEDIAGRVFSSAG